MLIRVRVLLSLDNRSERAILYKAREVIEIRNADREDDAPPNTTPRFSQKKLYVSSNHYIIYSSVRKSKFVVAEKQ